MCTIWLLEHYDFSFVVNLIIIIVIKYRHHRKKSIRTSLSIKNDNMYCYTKFEKHSLLKETWMFFLHNVHTTNIEVMRTVWGVDGLCNRESKAHDVDCI